MKKLFFSLILAISVFAPGYAQPDSSATSQVPDTLTIADFSTVEDVNIESPSDAMATTISHFDRTVTSFKWDRVVALVVPFASGVGLVWLLLAYRNRRHRDRLRIIELSITHGQPLPDSFFRQAGIDPHRRLLSGYYWLGAGFAIVIFFLATFSPVSALGIFPIFIGIGNIIVGRTESRQKENNNNDMNF